MTYILPDDMQIGVNLLFMVPGKVGGSEPYVTNLVKTLAKRSLELTVFGVKGFSRAYPEIAAACEVVEAPWSSGAQALRIASEQTWIAYESRRRRLDLVHHAGGTAPFVRAVPSVLTIHDIQYRHYPENFVKPKRWWLSLSVPHSVRTSASVCVVSEWVKADLIQKLGLDPKKIVVVPFGSEGLVGEPDIEGVRARYKLNRPFVFYPSRTYPHKNHLFLINAFAPLADRVDLVLTGAAWFRDRLVIDLANQLGISPAVRHLGEVSRDELAGLYKGAVALVYPSLFEGFGAPLLEAMSLGCPVITSNAASIPEVVGDAGVLLDPNDQQAWRHAIEKVLNDPTHRTDLSRRGSERATRFDWDASAEAQIQAYEMALA